MLYVLVAVLRDTIRNLFLIDWFNLYIAFFQIKLHCWNRLCMKWNIITTMTGSFLCVINNTVIGWNGGSYVNGGNHDYLSFTTVLAIAYQNIICALECFAYRKIITLISVFLLWNCFDSRLGKLTFGAYSFDVSSLRLYWLTDGIDEMQFVHYWINFVRPTVTHSIIIHMTINQLS